MGMRLRPGLRRIGYYSIAVLALYFLFIRERRDVEKFKFVIKDVEPQTVWEYWADFSNYKNINPTV